MQTLNFPSFPSISSRPPATKEQTETIVEFLVGSTLFSLVAGLTYGSITAILTNISHLPEGREHVFRNAKLFGNLGLVYGITGTLLIIANNQDGYRERIAASGATGIALGIHKKSIGVGIGGIVGFGLLSLFAKWIDYNDTPQWNRNDQLKQVLKPVYSTRREPLIIYQKGDNFNNDNYEK